MKYKVTKNGEVVKNNMSKKQAEEYCEKMNQDFMDSQEKIRKQQHKSGLPLRKNKYELYKVEVVKENVIRLTEDDLTRIVKRVINESSNEEDVKGKKCESCGKGTYEETGPMDDLRGTLHCSKCDKMVDRYKKYTPFKKKSNKLSESDLMRIVKRVINEESNEDSFHDDTESVHIQIMNILRPIYKTYGMEGVVSVLTDILGTIEDVGDESFMGPEDYM